MTLGDRNLPENALFYSCNGGGISDQKLALFGLFLKSFREGPLRIVLPDLVVFDQVTSAHQRVPLRTVFQIDPLYDFATRHGIEVLDIAPCGDEGGWSYLQYGRNYLPCAKLGSELGVDSVACDFFRALVPAIGSSRLLQHLADEAFRRKGIRTVAALRIESDWTREFVPSLATFAGKPEDNDLSFKQILSKIRLTLPDLRPGIYVVCDEAALPVSKEEIRSITKAEFGIDLYWKSDFVPPADLQGLSLLDLSLLDFETAIAGECFVGLSRSTFSNLVSFEKYVRTRSPVTAHYIYNVPGSQLALRSDDGIFNDASLAVASDPKDKEFSFELAQLYHANGERARALSLYLARAEMGGPLTEEVFVSFYRAAQLQAELQFAATEVIATYLRGADVLPSRAEAFHGASRHCRNNRLFQQGYEVARRAINLAPPATGLFIESWIYDWGVLDEFAVNAFWAGHYAECLDASLRILERGQIPENERPRILKNARYALDRLQASRPTATPEAQSSPAIPEVSNLASLHAQHHGKGSDKGDSYFAIYDEDKLITLEIISATRLPENEFWNTSALGLSLKRLAHDPRIVPHIAYENQRGLAEVFNARILAPDSHDLLVFIHDDVWIDDHFLADHVLEGLRRYDVIGVAGNRRRVPRQPAYHVTDTEFTSDRPNLSGSVAHGARPFGDVLFLGAVPADCELLDGVFLAVRKSALKANGVLFDPRFRFHFYDMDFCRSARQRGLRLGTWPICLTHQSLGFFGTGEWIEHYRLYLEKWGE